MDVVIDDVATVSGQVDLMEPISDGDPASSETVSETVAAGTVAPASSEQRLLVDRNTERSELEDDLRIEEAVVRIELKRAISL